ncbi:MAG TPA: pyridoxamine 5'-phosphate oxidase family protein [Gemmatimonadaceae bacterium]|jgi:nitroimidazol reductase NimA-like FMN-containing flavoprotein (pyridoxamine 5'-phosphate oxidase superfamily)|nr:pyridoxamine 5'-phosphate oxidase family protein [Gemmatimonadaceae bacterium]
MLGGDKRQGDRPSIPAFVERAGEADIPPVRRDDVVFRELSRDEIEAMLLRNKVGRLAFSFHDRVDIQPIHYAYERGWLYGRTSEGEKIAAITHNQWIAFEVDEVTDVFDWRSIVIHGSFWILHPRGSPRAEEVWTKAAELVSKIVPGSLTEYDPVGFRHTLFRIAISDVRGRQAMLKSVERDNP